MTRLRAAPCRNPFPTICGCATAADASLQCILADRNPSKIPEYYRITNSLRTTRKSAILTVGSAKIASPPLVRKCMLDVRISSVRSLRFSLAVCLLDRKKHRIADGIGALQLLPPRWPSWQPFCPQFAALTRCIFRLPAPGPAAGLIPFAPESVRSATNVAAKFWCVYALMPYESANRWKTTMPPETRIRVILRDRAVIDAVVASPAQQSGNPASAVLTVTVHDMRKTRPSVESFHG